MIKEKGAITAPFSFYIASSIALPLIALLCQGKYSRLLINTAPET